MMPLSFATYPAIALRLPGCDVERLKRSLSKALELVPSAAGRLRDDAWIGFSMLFQEVLRLFGPVRPMSWQHSICPRPCLA